ncbi:MAG: DUF86 domain-containing protein [Gemmatimonadetes bacterium]|nr:DUF86 domain-containing protein [Gemmatimonadota bacterium]MDE3258637.1 DUF86 domain-containing protein [Gemmatimonadota bacterium]
MPRDARAYLSDVIEACDAITSAVRGLDLQNYVDNRLVRSSVEREFIIIGEALAALHRMSKEIFGSITRARRIVDFRNQLTHQYPNVDDAIVWAIIERDVPVLRSECTLHLSQIHQTSESAPEEGE